MANQHAQCTLSPLNLSAPIPNTHQTDHPQLSIPCHHPHPLTTACSQLFSVLLLAELPASRTAMVADVDTNPKSTSCITNCCCCCCDPPDPPTAPPAAGEPALPTALLLLPPAPSALPPTPLPLLLLLMRRVPASVSPPPAAAADAAATSPPCGTVLAAELVLRGIPVAVFCCWLPLLPLLLCAGCSRRTWQVRNTPRLHGLVTSNLERGLVVVAQAAAKQSAFSVGSDHTSVVHQCPRRAQTQAHQSKASTVSPNSSKTRILH